MEIKKYHLFILITISILFLDQLTKFLVRKTLTIHQSIPIIKNFFHITRIHNQGIGFGLLQNYNLNWLFILLTLIIIIVILYYLKQEKNKSMPIIAYALIFTGAIGNVIDRLFFHFVIDFIDFKIWPAFNIADSAISIGAIILIIYFWKK